MPEPNAITNDVIASPPADAGNDGVIASGNSDSQFQADDAANDFESFRPGSDVWDSLTIGDTTTTQAAGENDNTDKTDDTQDTKGDADDEDEEIAAIFADEDATLDREKLLDEAPSKRMRKWAERRDKKASLVDDFQGVTAITDVAAKLRDASPARFQELSQHLAHSLVDSDPNGTFQRAYVQARIAKDPQWDWRSEQLPSIDDVISGKFAAHTASTHTASPDSEQGSSTADELDAYFDFDWRDPANDDQFLDDRELALAKAARKFESDARNGNAAENRLKELEKQLADIQGTTQNAVETKLESTVKTVVEEYRDSLTSKLIPQIAKVTGLEVSPSDIPEVKAVKELLLQAYTGTAYERENGFASDFEVFALNESSVAGKLKEVFARVQNAKVEQAKAEVAGNADEAARYKALADEERVPLMVLFKEANNEFKARHSNPVFELIAKLSGTKSITIGNQGERIEATQSSGTPSLSPKPIDARNADDFWEKSVSEGIAELRRR